MDFSQILMDALGVVLTSVLIYALKLGADYLKSKIPPDALEKAAEAAVQAVEQLQKSGQLAEMENKKDAALRIASGILEAQLAARGIKIKIDLVVLGDLIEAKVWELLNSKKEPEGEG